MTADINTNFLTPQEFAERLKISTYTAYELIKRGEISAVRVGRQLRIAETEYERYIESMSTERQRQKSEAPDEGKVLTVAGSHDPALELLISQLRKEHPSLTITPSYIGSLEGLIALFHRRAVVAAAHLWDDNASRARYLQHVVPNQQLTVVRLVCRCAGIGARAGNPKAIEGLEDLTRPGITFINRQAGSGTRVRLERILAEEKLDSNQITGYDEEVDTHHAVAMAVGTGDADAGIISQSVAAASGLHFIPLYWEPFELVMEDSNLAMAGVAALFETVRSADFRERLAQLEGYDSSETGQTWKVQT